MCCKKEGGRKELVLTGSNSEVSADGTTDLPLTSQGTKSATAEVNKKNIYKKKLRKKEEEEEINKEHTFKRMRLA